MSRNIFTQNSNQNNNSQGNIFTNKNQSSNNMFTSQSNSNSMNNNQNTNNNYNSSNQGNNIFSNQNTNNSNQNQGGNPFATNKNQTNNIFNQNTQPNNNIFNNSSNNQQGNIFNNNNNQQGNIFNNSNNQQGNIFNQNNQRGNYSQNNSNQMFDNNNMSSNNPNMYFQQPIYLQNLSNMAPQHQAQLIKNLSHDQIRREIKYCLENLIEPKKLQNVALSNSNMFKNYKVGKLAKELNIKKEILHIKKEVKDNVVKPIQTLKAGHLKLAQTSNELIMKLSQRLTKLKQELIETITQNKMRKDIKQQFQEIDSQVQDFLRPLYNSYQKRSNYTFIDPDPFCLKISENILKNITYLDDKMDELLACQGQASQQSISISNTIELLTSYYVNVALELQQFTIKYSEIKKKKVSSNEGTKERIRKKANDVVNKQLKAYNLLKEIEEILQQRVKWNIE